MLAMDTKATTQAVGPAAAKLAMIVRDSSPPQAWTGVLSSEYDHNFEDALLEFRKTLVRAQLAITS
jgi:hypothetical protein